MPSNIQRDFLRFLMHERGLKADSAEHYLEYIEHLYKAHSGEILEIEKYQYIANYIIDIKLKRGWSDRTTYKMASMVCVFYNWAARIGLIKESPMRLGHSFKRCETKQIDFFDWDTDDFKKLCNNPYSSVRTRTIINLLRASGIRASELCSLEIQEHVMPYYKDGWIKIKRGKGGDDRFAPIDPEAIKWLETYLNDLKCQGSNQKQLFLSEHRDKPLKPHGLYMLISQAGKRLGIKAYPHKFRHSLGGRIIENGGDVTLVRDVLGHKTLSSTNIYTHLKKEKVKSMYDKFISPIENDKFTISA